MAPMNVAKLKTEIVQNLVKFCQHYSVYSFSAPKIAAENGAAKTTLKQLKNSLLIKSSTLNLQYSDVNKNVTIHCDASTCKCKYEIAATFLQDRQPVHYRCK